MIIIDEVAGATLPTQFPAADSEAVAPEVAGFGVLESASAGDTKVVEEKNASREPCLKQKRIDKNGVATERISGFLERNLVQ